ETGTPRLLEAEYDDGVLVPVRGRSTMERVMPWIARKMPTFKRYAAASLADIFGEEAIEKAERHAVTELRSGVFLSRASVGGYAFEPLPRMGQIAPIFGVAAGDFDGDGRADIYAVQNSYAPIPEVGRFAGGLSQLLRGDGKGGFAVADVAETQLIVPGDAKGLAVLDVDRDGWPEFLVTRTTNEALVFGNTGVAGRTMRGVILRGRGGNPTAVGARVTAVLADGSTQTAEVSAGVGYLAQSSATLFFGAPDENPLVRLRVRWPWGEATEVAVPAGAGLLRISAPPE
ncbi:MAG TPA: CRTAC1 family protein, partial [Opitutus sp.]|nr:CRTAC1 family protein [Opitutus sp.]